MSSEDESSDDVPLAELISGMRGTSPELGEATPKTIKNTKQKKRRKKKDPNEPQKPISAYALFFRDTQAAIKGQNPNASFGEVSKIVASMWDGLEPDAKNVYKKTAEAAKKEYAKALSLYKAKTSQSGEQSNLGKTSHSSSPTRKSSDEEENDGEDGEGSFEENQVSSKVINLADSPELTGGNDANKLDKESKQSSGGIMSSDDDDEPLKKPSGISKSAEDSSVTNAPSSNAAQQQSEMKPPMNGDVIDADEIQQICLRNGCENLAIDSPEWDKEYCSSECVVVHCSSEDLSVTDHMKIGAVRCSYAMTTLYTLEEARSLIKDMSFQIDREIEFSADLFSLATSASIGLNLDGGQAYEIARSFQNALTYVTQKYWKYYFQAAFILAIGYFFRAKLKEEDGQDRAPIQFGPIVRYIAHALTEPNMKQMWLLRVIVVILHAIVALSPAVNLVNVCEVFVKSSTCVGIYCFLKELKDVVHSFMPLPLELFLIASIWTHVAAFTMTTGLGGHDTYLCWSSTVVTFEESLPYLIVAAATASLWFLIVISLQNKHDQGTIAPQQVANLNGDNQE